MIMITVSDSSYDACDYNGDSGVMVVLTTIMITSDNNDSGGSCYGGDGGGDYDGDGGGDNGGSGGNDGSGDDSGVVKWWRQ